MSENPASLVIAIPFGLIAVYGLYNALMGERLRFAAAEVRERRGNELRAQQRYEQQQADERRRLAAEKEKKEKENQVS